jgi:hypothetical protein
VKRLILAQMPQMPKDVTQNTKQKTSALQKQFGEMNINMSYPRECIKKFDMSNLNFSTTTEEKSDGNDPILISLIEPMTSEP